MTIVSIVRPQSDFFCAIPDTPLPNFVPTHWTLLIWFHFRPGKHSSCVCILYKHWSIRHHENTLAHTHTRTEPTIPFSISNSFGLFVLCVRFLCLFSHRRGLTPPHRVKSISMATFSTDEIEFIKSHGNELCAKTWLGLWDPKRVHTQNQRELMIDKYERKR